MAPAGGRFRENILFSDKPRENRVFFVRSAPKMRQSREELYQMGHDCEHRKIYWKRSFFCKKTMDNDSFSRYNSIEAAIWAVSSKTAFL